MNRKTLLPAGLVALVVVLIGVNLALREDPEPDFTEPPPPLPASSAAEDAVSDRAQAHADEAFEAPPAAGAEAPDPAAEQVEQGCDHPLIPAEPGQWRRYRWTQSGQDQVAVLRLRAGRTRALNDEEREVRWQVRISSEDGQMEPAQTSLVTRCRPGQDSEDPWFGILEVLGLGVRFLDEPGRWRWPAELARGQTFEGVTQFDPRGAHARAPDDVAGPATLQVRRTHVVEGREAIEVPAGRFTAWKVVYEERQSFGDRGETGTGTIWVAADVGMVKSRAENSAGVVQTLELTRVGDP